VLSLALLHPTAQHIGMKLNRAAFVLASISVVLSVFGSASSSAPDRREIDRIVSLTRGRRIALRCSGEGKFTVLLETGDGGRRAHMAKLFTALTKRHRVCAYDRRNVGLSSTAPLPRKSADLAGDAFEALSAAGVRGPYLLFGTSMGGLLVRSYAARPDVAGIVTSNQPGTSREWKMRAYPVMSSSERAADTAWMAGNNNEHIDADDVSRSIDVAGGPLVPHIIMISTERFQCPGAGVCGPTYRAFVAASQDAARAGLNGELRVIDGDHDLYVTNLDAVVSAIDQVATKAMSRR
jgi:pimeloyl-ACP methyl ester carboxylesterase